MSNQDYNSISSDLIVALDKLPEKEAKEKTIEISEAVEGEIGNVVFKINDLLADIGLKSVRKFFNRAESKGDIKQRIVVEADLMLRNFGINGLKEYFYGEGAGIFLDPKWHDISNTLENYIEKLYNSGLSNKAKYVTIHASNGYEAIKKVVLKKEELGLKTKILAVTALTSLKNSDTNVLFDENRKHSVLKLAKDALEAGVDGIVCSPKEAQLLRDVFGDYDFEIITPGVRFEDKKVEGDDQVNVMTPEKAINQGSNHIVMGRPILQSNDVKETIQRFFKEVKGVGYCSDEQRHEFEKLLYTGNWEELLRYIGAFYFKPEGGKYCRLASGLLSNAYINIGASERNYLVVERAANEMADEIKDRGIEADVVMGAQMGSVRMSLTVAEKLGIEESVYTEKVEYDDNEVVTVADLDGEGYIKGKGHSDEIPVGVDNKPGEYVRKLPKEEQLMKLKRHDISLKGKKVILSEDIVTKGSTLEKMIELVENSGGEVVAITCVGNRYGKDNFNGIPLICCYNPPAFELYHDEETPKKEIKDYPKLPKGSQISEKPKNDWSELVESMR